MDVGNTEVILEPSVQQWVESRVITHPVQKRGYGKLAKRRASGSRGLMAQPIEEVRARFRVRVYAGRDYKRQFEVMKFDIVNAQKFTAKYDRPQHQHYLGNPLSYLSAAAALSAGMDQKEE